ncbi:MAG: hypothetical protein VB876_13915 [Pirellulales bacterium]
MRTASGIAGSGAAFRARKRPMVTRPEAANIGDHAAIEHLLATVLQRPSTLEFNAQLDEPSYDPSDRLIVKCDDEIIGHIRSSWRTIRMGRANFPLCRFDSFAVLPEYRTVGVPEALFTAVERRLSKRGTAIGELDMRDAMIGQNDDWIKCGRCVYSQASPRDILSQLSVEEDRSQGDQLLDPARGERSVLSVRHWRQVELPALMRIYQANLASSYGLLARSEAYWRWLVSRRAFDQIFVAIEGRDRLSLEEDGCRIVGYAVTKGHHIVEMMAEPSHSEATARLLHRACSDAIERDWHTVRFHAPACHPLHAVLVEAGGDLQRQTTESTRQVLVRLPETPSYMRCFASELLDRAIRGNLAFPVELGIQVSAEKRQLNLTESAADLIDGRLGRSYVSCDRATWNQLRLGYCDAECALADGSLAASTTLAADMAQTLFPKVPLWRPPWDDLAV